MYIQYVYKHLPLSFATSLRTINAVRRMHVYKHFQEKFRSRNLSNCMSFLAISQRKLFHTGNIRCNIKEI